jgi:hypothetical protein
MKIINARLVFICEENKILTDEQAGFRTFEECVGQAAALIETCQRRKNNKDDSFLCFIDFQKAYDMVPHQGLIAKLKMYGIHGKMLKVIESIYMSTKMVVRHCRNEITDAFRYERGVRQGCPASPTLFNLYINDILNKVSKTKIPGSKTEIAGLMFADDIVVIGDSMEVVGLQVQEVAEWAKKWRMVINPGKCGVLPISGKNEELVCEGILLENGRIEKVSEYIYLGFLINQELDFNKMVSRGVEKGKSTVRLLTPLLINKRVPLAIKIQVIKSVLIPIMSYGCEIFGMNIHRTCKMDSVLLSSLKIVIGSRQISLNRSTEELGIVKISERAIIGRMRAAVKWKNSRTTIGKLIREYSAVGRKQTWISTNEAWLLKFFKRKDYNNFIEIKEELIGLIKKRRGNEDEDQVIGRMGILLELGRGKYIEIEAGNRKVRLGISTLLKMRTGCFQFINKLIIGKIIPEVLKNKCLICGVDCIEDMKHIFLDCPGYEIYRKSMREFFNNEELRSTVNPEDQLRVLLGGRSDFSSSISKNGLMIGILFLNEIIPIRHMTIKSIVASM